MPLLKPEDFEALSAHLAALDPIIDAFCQKHGFVQQTSPSLGRYPRRRMTRTTDVNLIIDLQMDVDDAGEYYSSFSPELPYSMGAGAWIDRGKTRYSAKWVKCFQGVPFSQLSTRLASELEKALSAIDGWDSDSLEMNGERSTISTTAQSCSPSSRRWWQFWK